MAPAACVRRVSYFAIMNYNTTPYQADTYFLETFGCQMNVLDSQLVEGQLRDLGLRRVATIAQADVILFNTCSVRQHAEDKVLSRLGRLKHLKRRRPAIVIGVLGCMAERQREELLASVPHLDLICGPGELYRLPTLLTQVWTQRRQVAALTESKSRRADVLDRAAEPDPLEALEQRRFEPPDSDTCAPVPGREGSGPRGSVAAPVADLLQSYVRVQRGCDKFCTYCVVPFVRGPERSRPPAAIVEECRRLAEHGCREVTLLGQTVNSYVHPEEGRAVRLAELLERVHAIESLDRIRFVTSYPADWDEDVFRVLRDYPRVCPYLHLPAQSGSDRILKAMKRGYTAAEYLHIVDAARRYVPDIGLAGDFIVGFCGETEADHQATIDLIQRVEYQGLFVFKYSPRPGTAAERSQADDVPAEVKAHRNNELLAIQAEIGLRHRQRFVGQAVEVLVEGPSKSDRAETADRPARPPDAPAPVARQLTGRTPTGLITVFAGTPDLIGAIVRARVESASALTLFGRVESVISPARPRSPVGLS